MSRFSGKCDFRDHIEIFGAENILKSRVYVGNNVVPMRFEKVSDLIPYYPYIIATSSSIDGVGEIHLSSESFVDTFENKTLQYCLKDAKREYRRSKRNHKPFDETILKLNFYANYQREIYYRVLHDGERATTDGIHTEFANLYRDELYDEMINNGWPKWQAYLWVYKDFRTSLKLMNEEAETGRINEESN